LNALAARLAASVPNLRETPTTKALLRRIRSRLKQASDQQILAVAQHDIYRYVDEVEPPREARGMGTVRAIAGGVKDFKRQVESIQLQRADGAWFHFTLTVAETEGGPLDLLAYDFELVYPDGHQPRFLRFDLNLPGHANDSRELRSHLHPGCDDLLVPAPILHPFEAIDLMLNLPVVAR
jgi:hypothetical protein